MQSRIPANMNRSFSSSQHNQSTPKVDYSSLGGTKKNLPDWKPESTISVTKPGKPDWKWGEGVKGKQEQSHVEIDPFEEGRPMFHNYTLLVSGIAPRPIGLVSTVSKEGKLNLAPFSYFQVVDHDPPVFVIGFSGRANRPKDTLRNLEETGECVLNIVSEDMIEAVNATSVDAPYGTSEWSLSGLTKSDSTTVKPPRVKESVMSIEGKLTEVVNYKTSRPSVGPHGSLAIIEATRFWVAENAIDEKRSHVDLNVLRPIGQLGGVSYARITDTFELPRTNWATAVEKSGSELLDVAKEETTESDGPKSKL
ncbi:hypothetical protein D6C90_09383 [Aureobasidium pullulans]|uniref:Flavin reductase like domain-containing protein n=1 Tax=Aureobasidium pullulans TaxID=5580 RepID=A0A4S9TDW2_AURPU|nr:hypothetical protein D6C90_09383 [Aureobasidium pullulans]